jgi:hypothetical protein
MMQLLGPGAVYKGLALSRDEFKAVNKLYGLKPEPQNKKPPPPPAPEPADFPEPWKYNAALQKHEEAIKHHQNWQDPQALLQAGADRNALRAAESDGLRLLAWFAKFVPAGEDPLAHLIQITSEAGLDIAYEDVTWANETEG